MKNYEPTPRQSLAIREFVSEAITPLIEDVLVKKLGQAMAFLKEQEQTGREWVGLTDEERKQIVSHINDPFEWSHAIEAKLKEKNVPQP